MEFRSSTLPPLKRLMLKRREEEAEEKNQNKKVDDQSWLHLPAKKRKGSHRDAFSAFSKLPTYILPAKKRVLALPYLSPIQVDRFPFDLNHQYSPSPRKFKKEDGKNFTDLEGEEVEGNSSLFFYTSEEKDVEVVDNRKDYDEFQRNSFDGYEDVEKEIDEEAKKGGWIEKMENEGDDGIGCDVYRCNKIGGDEGIENKSQDSSGDAEIRDWRSIHEDEDGIERKFQNDIRGIKMNDKNINDQIGEETNDEIDDVIECAICGGADGYSSDPIVFCDGCDLMVHVTCFGNPLIRGIPEGDWFCHRCVYSRSDKILEEISCCLCPMKGGAMKTTNGGRWAHIVCALLVPEAFFEDPDGREGIDCSKVPSWRWKKICYLCKDSNGCAIDCSVPDCDLAFHVTCALKGGLCIEYKTVKRKKSAIIAGFCGAHSDIWKKEQKTGKFRIVASQHKMN